MGDADNGTRTNEARRDAQRRADQVAAFARELSHLERADVLSLSPDDRTRVERYHAELLTALARQFDVDRTDIQHQMTLGMRAASLIGAVTLSAGIVLFFYRFWGLLTTAAQLGLLAAMPVALLLAVDIAARREPSRYLASVLSVIAAAGFALDLAAAGSIFGIAPSPHALAAWALFALAAAYAYGLRLLLAGGLAAAIGYGVALTAHLAGYDWTILLERPEPMILLGACAFAGSFWRPLTGPDGFARTWRIVGMTGLLLPLLFLASATEAFSYRPLPLPVLRAAYDILGFGLPVAGISVGVRRRWPEVVYGASLFLALFVCAKCFDWWWDLLPRYLFFLVLGALAMGALALLSRTRLRMRGV